MGWDDTEIIQNDGLLKELKNPAFYYLHSYYFDVDNSEKESITSICNYGDVPIISTIQKFERNSAKMFQGQKQGEKQFRFS